MPAFQGWTWRGGQWWKTRARKRVSWKPAGREYREEGNGLRAKCSSSVWSDANLCGTGKPGHGCWGILVECWGQKSGDNELRSK